MEGELVEELPIEEVVIEEKRGWLKPTLDETYIILLKNDPNPSVYVVSEINEGDNIKQGDKFGMIRFGSRVDLYFNNYEVMIKTKQKTIAGETIIARKK